MSSLTFTIEFPPETLALQAKLKDTPNLMRQAILRGMRESREPMVSAIQLERLTGTGPFPVEDHKLGIRTGHLRNSVNPSEVREDGAAVSFAVGTNMEYAAVHEFGFNGQVQVRSHQRSRLVSSVVETVSPKNGRTYRKKATSKVSGMVREHTRWLQIPARAPFGHGASDNIDIITRAITRNLRGIWGGSAA